MVNSKGLLTASALLDGHSSSSRESSEYDDDSWDPTAWIRKKARGTPDDPTDLDYQPEKNNGRKGQAAQTAPTDPKAILLYGEQRQRETFPSSSKRYHEVDFFEEPQRRLHTPGRKFEAGQSALTDVVLMPRYADHRETNTSALKRESSSDYEEEFTPPCEKKGRLNPVWTKDAIDSLLQLRYQLCAAFEDGEPAVTRGWYKIATMLNPFPCTPEDCRVKFDSLSQAYFKMLKNMQMGAWHDPTEFRRLQYIERIFTKSPRTAEAYARAHSQHNERMMEESLPEPKTILEYVNRYNFAVGALFRIIITDQQSWQEREKQFEALFDDFSRLRERKKSLIALFLKKILGTLSRPNALNETFRLLCKVFIALIDGECWTLVDEFRRMIAVQNEAFEDVALLLSCFSRSVFVLVEADPSDEEGFIRMLPDSDKCFTKILKPPLEIHPTLVDCSFKGQLKMNKPTVEKIIGLVAPHITSCHAYSKRISIERQVILSLWYMVNLETLEQLSIRFSIRSLDVSKVIQSFCTIVSDKGNLIEWPAADGLKKIVLGFENLSENAFPGVAGALGVKYVSLKVPSGFQRASAATISLQGVADSNFVFTDLFVSTIEENRVDRHDCYEPAIEQELPREYRKLNRRDVFGTSPLYRRLHPYTPKHSSARPGPRLLWGEIHLVSDSTYPLSMAVMVPFCTDEKSALQSHGVFDSRLNDARRFVEVAFGKAVSRFFRLCSLDYVLEKNVALIKACIGLHNLCMRAGDDFNPLPIYFPEALFLPKIETPPEAVVKRAKILEVMSRGASSYVFRQDSTPKAVQESN